MFERTYHEGVMWNNERRQDRTLASPHGEGVRGRRDSTKETEGMLGKQEGSRGNAVTHLW